ncbi:MAG TPA: hypothetical protein VMA74_19065 [Dyella sp.]|uniref:hypothetical protein n=1 Tax=Dyella sp. TaxID=1869338 RepID=UPI002C8E47A2|nr:hypothetical protein [Dyella sp.]HUB91829.1 hypothetical protein [Dyella sp.]
MQISGNPNIASLANITSEPPLPAKPGAGFSDTGLEMHNPINFNQESAIEPQSVGWPDGNRDARGFLDDAWHWLSAPFVRIFGSSPQGSLPDFQKDGWTRQTSPEEPYVTTYSNTFGQPYGGQGKIEIKYEFINDKPTKMTRTELDKNDNPTKSSAEYYNEYPNVAKEETITYKDGKPSSRTDDLYTVSGKFARRERYTMGEDNRWQPLPSLGNPPQIS